MNLNLHLNFPPGASVSPFNLTSKKFNFNFHFHKKYFYLRRLSELKYIFIICIVITSLSFAQSSGGVEVTKTYYPNGALKTEGEYWNGQLHGNYKEYYPNGRIWKEWHFFQGKEDGISTWYFEDGIKSIEWNYRNGEKEGTSKWYYETGELWS
jgi:hypothetical protein